MINEEEFMDIRALHRQGLTYAEIGRIVGRDWRTVKRYLTEGAQPRYRRKRVASKLDPFKPRIDQWLAKDAALQATRIHQDLVRDYGFTGAYPTVRRYVERARPRKPEPVSERFETAPGHQAQVDWSHEAPIRTSSGLELPLYGFHMVLGHSRDAFVALVGSQDLVTFWACHRAGFRHFGGVPHEILYDRTKTVVRSHVGTERRAGDRVYHPEALASAHHYGFKLRLCRPYRDRRRRARSSPTSPTSASASCAPTPSATTSRPTASGRPGMRTSPATASTAPTGRSSRCAPSAIAPRSARWRRSPTWSSQGPSARSPVTG